MDDDVDASGAAEGRKNENFCCFEIPTLLTHTRSPPSNHEWIRLPFFSLLFCCCLLLVEGDDDFVVSALQQHLALKGDDAALLGRLQRPHQRLELLLQNLVLEHLCCSKQAVEGEEEKEEKEGEKKNKEEKEKKGIG